MVNMTDIQIGSVVLNMVEDIPTILSGATLWNMVDNEVYFAEQYTGDSIGITAIADKYQPAIISLTASAVLRMMEMQGMDVNNLKLGDFSVSKGQGSSATVTSAKMRDDGLMKLETLGQSVNVFKALG